MDDGDLVAPAIWGNVPLAMHSMRLQKTREAYARQDLATVIVEAEELLSDDPDNDEALEILGDAELDLGHGREAMLVYSHLTGLVSEKASAWNGLAVARFLMVDFEGCLDAARKALALEADLAESHAYAGLSLERLGRSREASIHLRRAARLDPTAYPHPIPENRVDWNLLVSDAMDRIPPEIREFYGNVPVVFHHLPDPAVLLEADPPITPLVMVLYEGQPPEDGDPAVILPRSIRVYKGNICRFAHDRDRLVEDLAESFISEAVEWLGIPWPEEGGEE